MTCNSRTEMLSLSTFSLSAVEWVAHKPVRSTSVMSGDGIESDSEDETPSASEEYNSGVYYTTSIVVPQHLPTNKCFVPTFHSCIVSRVYALHLSLSMDYGRMMAPLTVKLPVQVSAAASTAGQEQERLWQLEQQAAQDVEDTFEPRMVGPFFGTGRSTTMTSTMEMPPGYEVTNGYVGVRTQTTIA